MSCTIHSVSLSQEDLDDLASALHISSHDKCHKLTEICEAHSPSHQAVKLIEKELEHFRLSRIQKLKTIFLNYTLPAAWKRLTVQKRLQLLLNTMRAIKKASVPVP